MTRQFGGGEPEMEDLSALGVDKSDFCIINYSLIDSPFRASVLPTEREIFNEKLRKLISV